MRRVQRCKKTGKVIIRDELSAKIVLARPRDNADRESVPVRYYRCEFCNFLHLTSRPDKHKENHERRSENGKQHQGQENAGRSAAIAAKRIAESASSKIEGTTRTDAD